VESLEEAAIAAQVREDVLKGGYFLIDYRGYAGYEPGDNVVHIFSMGSPSTEAIKASRQLLEKGIYANVIVVTSPDLLLGNLAHADDYYHLRHGLGVNADLHIQSLNLGTDGVAKTLSGRRIPVVSVHDGEIGLLDNIGSVVGVRQETLAVRKHSRCGRPSDVYRYHHLDADSIVEACGKVLAETALENTYRSGEAQMANGNGHAADWHQLWPSGGK
jgi:pyruvate dehydrogenase E1 component